MPFQVTRSLDALRAALRPRGTRTAGLVASSGARRLRAEGLGATLPHQDDDAVARWFLDRWPDVRSSDALEVVATEFSVQGLELDRVGLCWDADLVRADGQVGGAPVPRQRLDPRGGGGAIQPDQRLSRAADPRAARHGHLGAAGQRARPDPGAAPL